MRARDPIILSMLALCLTAQAHALPVVRIARADHHPAAMVGSDTADYIRNSAFGDMFAIETARVAQNTSHNYDVRRFSQMIISDHTAMQNALAVILKQDEFAMTLPPLLDASHAALVKQVEDATVADFDADFMQQQIVANQSALRVQASYARSGRDLSLREFASATIPKIQMHLVLAERIFRQLSPKTASVPH